MNFLTTEYEFKMAPVDFELFTRLLNEFKEESTLIQNSKLLFIAKGFKYTCDLQNLLGRNDINLYFKLPKNIKKKLRGLRTNEYIYFRVDAYYLWIISDKTKIRLELLTLNKIPSSGINITPQDNSLITELKLDELGNFYNIFNDYSELYIFTKNATIKFFYDQKGIYYPMGDLNNFKDYDEAYKCFNLLNIKTHEMTVNFFDNGKNQYIKADLLYAPDFFINFYENLHKLTPTEIQNKGVSISLTLFLCYYCFLLVTI